MDLLETIKYRGYTINIYPDVDEQGPNETGDNSVMFLTGYHRDFWVEDDQVTKEECQALMSDDPEEYGVDKARIKELRAAWHVFGLEAYIHSGVALALSREGNFPDRQWDVSQVGCVFVTKKEAKTKAAARKMAQSLIEEWNQYLSGDVYYFEIEEDTVAGGGYYGIDYVRSAAKDEVDYLIRWKVSQHEKLLKKYIKSGVPIIYRRPCTIN